MCDQENDVDDLPATLDNKRSQFGTRFLTDEAEVFQHNACSEQQHVDYEFTRARKKPAGGERKLSNKQDIFKFNAWDHVQWDEEQERLAAEAVQKNSLNKMPQLDKEKFLNNADNYWDSFYDIHTNRFFKDRHWLFTEFPELVPKETQKELNIFELGCGVGNTLLPILKYNQNEKLQVYGCDFSTRAIEIFQEQEEFDAKRCQVFVMDATLENWESLVPFAPASLDIIVLIFVLSAIEPSKMKLIVENCYKYLRSGGMVLFRDYGRYDLAQLRFKSGKCLTDNLYVRGDGTMVYFFTLEEVKSMFVEAGFKEEQALIDRRLQVNRGRMLKMYRVWLQAKFSKPS